MSTDAQRPPAVDPDAEQEVDFGRYWRAIAARWWLPVGGLVIGLVVGYLVSVGTNSTNYKIDIYRLGYYGGNGARKVATTAVTSASVLARPVFLTTLPQGQGGCATNDPTGLTDCGTWEPSASWLSTNAVSGIYVAKLTRNDTGGSSHIVFIVRDDARHADVLVQTSDTTWQAYNQYGGYSLYSGPDGAFADRATAVSFDRQAPYRRSTG